MSASATQGGHNDRRYVGPPAVTNKKDVARKRSDCSDGIRRRIESQVVDSIPLILIDHGVEVIVVALWNRAYHYIIFLYGRPM